MSKKIPLGVAVALIFLTAAITVAITITVYMNIYNTLISDLPERAQLYSNLSDIDELVRAQYYGNINSDTLDSSIARGYIEGLDDEYSRYMSAADYSRYYSEMLGKVSGIGIETSFDDKKGYILVDNVADDSPAQRSGIQKGNYITAVNGEKVTADNYNELSSSFEGEKLTSIRLDLLTTDNAGKEVATSVNVAKGYDAQSLSYSITGTIGVIKITAFYESTAADFTAAVNAMNESGVTGLIIDVRNNSSSNLEYAAKVIDLIVPLATEGTGAIATAKNALGENVELYAADSVSITLPVCVLVNDRTEGAAELLACDLRDYGKAKIVGETTAGHGTLQKIFRLDDGGAVLLTVAKIYPYISDCFDGVGVAPDYEVVMNEEQKNSISSLLPADDEQYKQAYALLTE